MSALHVVVSVADQSLRLLDGNETLAEYPISTAKNGTGCEEGSHCTPLGRFVICEKIGQGAPLGTAFKGRQAVDLWDGTDESAEDMILSRILWLDGLEPENGNTRDRYIYIHGTNQESRIGEPESHGCVRMRNTDVIELFDRVAEGTAVTIEP